MSFIFTSKLYREQNSQLKNDDELHFCNNVLCYHLKYDSYVNAVCHYTACYNIRAHINRVNHLLKQLIWCNFLLSNVDFKRVRFFKDIIYVILKKIMKSFLSSEILTQIILLMLIFTLRLIIIEVCSHFSI